MRTVICFRDLKQAALYFDRVLPIDFRKMAGTGSDIVVDFPEPVPSRALINIVFDKKPEEGDSRYEDFGTIVENWDEFRQDSHAYWSPGTISALPSTPSPLEAAYLRDARAPGSQSLRRLFATYAAAIGIVKPDILVPSDGANAGTASDDPVVRMSQLQLVNTARASWDQILDLRSDQEARVKLQRLRAFAETNYANKTTAYIEDDLSSRVDDYERASKKHGFELVTGSLSTLLDSSNLQAAAGATLAAAIIGGPVVAATAAVCIELGKFSLEFARRKNDITDWKNSHPLAYLIEARAAAGEA